eukprot:gene5166-8772_t
MNSEEEFANETSKKVIADVCNLLGYHGIRKNAMSILVELLQKFLQKIGERSAEYSNLCGRNECNFHDVVGALKDYDFNFNDLFDYCSQFNHHDNLTTFDIDIPNFPKKKRSRLPLIKNRTPLQPPTSNSSGNINEDEDVPKIPNFCPPLPPKYSYSFSPIFNETIKDQLTLQKMKTKQKRQIETSLTKIHGIELSKRKEHVSSPTKIEPVINPYLTLVKKSDDYEYLNVSEIEDAEHIIFEPNTNKRKLTQDNQENDQKKTKMDVEVNEID